MDASKKYNVGQVLYIVPTNDNKVIPVLVVEEITKRTLKGSVVTYRIQSGGDATKVFMIDDVKGTFFASPDAAKKSLIEIASARINKIVDHAAKKAREWYNSGAASQQDPLVSIGPDDMASMDDLEDVPDGAPVAKVQLDDGTVANIKITHREG